MLRCSIRRCNYVTKCREGLSVTQIVLDQAPTTLLSKPRSSAFAVRTTVQGDYSYELWFDQDTRAPCRRCRPPGVERRCRAGAGRCRIGRCVLDPLAECGL